MDQLFELFKKATGYELSCDELKNELNALPLDVVQDVLLNKYANPTKRKEICTYIKGLPSDRWSEAVHASLSQIYVMLTFTDTNDQPRRRDIVIEQYRHYAVTIWQQLNTLTTSGKADQFSLSLLKTIQDNFNIQLTPQLVEFGQMIIRQFIKIMLKFTLGELQTEPVSRLVDKMMSEMTIITDLCVVNKEMLMREGYILLGVIKNHPIIKEHSIYKNLERFIIDTRTGELLPLDKIMEQLNTVFGEDDPLLNPNGVSAKKSALSMSKLMDIVMSDGSMQSKVTQMFLTSLQTQNDDERQLYKSMTREEQVRHRLMKRLADMKRKKEVAMEQKNEVEKERAARKLRQGKKK